MCAEREEKEKEKEEEGKEWQESSHYPLSALGLELVHCYFYHILLVSPDSREWRNRLFLLMRGATKSHYKGINIVGNEDLQPFCLFVCFGNLSNTSFCQEDKS